MSLVVHIVRVVSEYGCFVVGIRGAGLQASPIVVETVKMVVYSSTIFKFSVEDGFKEGYGGVCCVAIVEILQSFPLIGSSIGIRNGW